MTIPPSELSPTDIPRPPDPSDPTPSPESKKPWYLQIHTQILLALVLAVAVAGAMRGAGYDAAFEVTLPEEGRVAAVEQVKALSMKAGAVAAEPTDGAIEVRGDVGAFQVAMSDLKEAGYSVEVASAPVTYEVFNFIGALFLRLLKMIIVPLVLASVVTGMLGIGDTRALGRLGIKTLIYYTATTGLAVFAGLLVVNILQPGTGDVEGARALMESAKPPTLAPTPLADVFLGIVPTNVAQALAKGDLLSVIFFSIVLGLATVTVGERGRSLAAVFESFNDVIMKITDWVMLTAPVGVFALLAAVLLKTGFGLLFDLGWYMIAVVVGLAVHAFIVLPTLLMVLGRANPLTFAKAMLPALLTAFSTSSSSATLPVTLDSVTDRAGYNRQTSSFVLPLGATINMDGTALYESVAAIFIANLYGIDLTLGQQVTIFLVASLAAVGAAGIPSAGLVTMIMVLKAVGLPLEGIGLIAGVDRLLDMCRTTVNVWGDSVGVAVIDRFEPAARPGEPGAMGSSES